MAKTGLSSPVLPACYSCLKPGLPRPTAPTGHSGQGLGDQFLEKEELGPLCGPQPCCQNDEALERQCRELICHQKNRTHSPVC